MNRYALGLDHHRGFGRTRRDRILIDLARVLNAHSVDAEHNVDDLTLASFVLAVLDARKVSFSNGEGS